MQLFYKKYPYKLIFERDIPDGAVTGSLVTMLKWYIGDSYVKRNHKKLILYKTLFDFLTTKEDTDIVLQYSEKYIKQSGISRYSNEAIYKRVFNMYSVSYETHKQIVDMANDCKFAILEEICPNENELNLLLTKSKKFRIQKVSELPHGKNYKTKFKVTKSIKDVNFFVWLSENEDSFSLSTQDKNFMKKYIFDASFIKNRSHISIYHNSETDIPMLALYGLDQPAETIQFVY